MIESDDDTKTFKSVFEFKGHAWLMEYTFKFRQITSDPADGYIPNLIFANVDPLDNGTVITVPITESQIRSLSTVKYWNMKQDFSISAVVNGFNSTDDTIKFEMFRHVWEKYGNEKTCSFKDFFMVFEPMEEMIFERGKERK